MHLAWLEILDRVLRPARPHLERCLRERERHLDARRRFADGRARAIADCERRINDARAVVFATNDGVVGARMTDLEREWRTLSRLDPDAGLMDLWARVAPRSWIDRKRWRDSAPAARVDAAIALAADAENVEAAEAAALALRAALAPHGVAIGSRIRWVSTARDSASAETLLGGPLFAAVDAFLTKEITERGGRVATRRRDALFARAYRIEAHVHEAALARLPGRPLLARDLAYAALADVLWRASPFDPTANPSAALAALWKTGYVIAEVDASSITLEIPPL
jgi:hypothetical protein